MLHSKFFILQNSQKERFSTYCWLWCLLGGWALDDWTWPQEVGQCRASVLCAHLVRTSSKWLQQAPKFQQEWQWTGQCRTKWSLQNGNPQTDFLLSVEMGRLRHFTGRRKWIHYLMFEFRMSSISGANIPIQKILRELETLWCSQGRGTDQGHRSESQMCSQRSQRAQSGNL